MLYNSSAVDYNAHKTTSFLRYVAEAKGITGSHIKTWICQVHRKLHKVGVTTVFRTIGTVIFLNRKLWYASLQMFHTHTIEIMAREGIKCLRQESEGLSGFSNKSIPLTRLATGGAPPVKDLGNWASLHHLKTLGCFQTLPPGTDQLTVSTAWPLLGS